MIVITMTEPVENAFVEPMRTRKAILWGDDDLLLKAVELLLNSWGGLDIIHFSKECDDETFIQDVKRIHPDVFILYEGTFFEKKHLLTRFARDFPRLKIITLSLDNNQLEIYSKYTLTIQKTSDLLSIISDDVDSEFI